MAVHGSWDRDPPRAPAVLWLPWDAQTRTLGSAITLVGGFQEPNGSRWGRTVDAAPGPDGALYVSDDQAGAVYRLVPGGPLRPSLPLSRPAVSSPPRVLSLEPPSYRVRRAWVFPRPPRARLRLSDYDIVLRSIHGDIEGGPNMRPPILDPTAGETARAARAHPEAAQRVLDPTDPRFGRVPTAGDPAGEVPRMFDPTDPDCDRQPA